MKVNNIVFVIFGIVNTEYFKILLLSDGHFSKPTAPIENSLIEKSINIVFDIEIGLRIGFVKAYTCATQQYKTGKLKLSLSYTVADQTNSDSEASGLSLEIEEDKINREDNKVELKLIEVQKFIGEAKTIIDKANNVLVHNNNSRRNFSYTKLGRFTDFIRYIIKILQTYDDNDLELFFVIIDGEVRKYHYRGCKFHELIDNDRLRKFIGKKLETIKSMTAADIRTFLAAIATKIEKKDYNKNEKEFIDFINSLYRQDAVEKFNKFLLNIDDYRLKNRRNIGLVSILSEGIRTVIFDYYTDLTPNARIALKSKLDEFWNYIMSVSASIVMQHYLNNPKISNSAKTYDADSSSDLSSKQQSSKTTKEKWTFKQMYVEKNLDLKYDPYAYDHLTTKYRSELKKAFSLHNNDQNTIKVVFVRVSTKTTNDPNILRQTNKEGMDSKTDLVKDKRSGKSKSSDKHKHCTKTTDDMTTLRQMFVEGMDSKNNSQVINDVIKSKSKHKKRSRVRQFKPFDDDNYSDKREGLRKTTEEAIALRQIYLENFDFKYYKPQVNTDSKEFKSKDNRLKYVRKNKVKNTDKAHHSVKTTDDPTTSRGKYVEVMNLKYEPPANRNYKELKKKSNVKAHASLDTGKEKRKYILREHKTKDNTGFSKAHKQNNIYIDVDTIYVTNDKHRMTKDHRVLKQKYLKNKDKYLSTVTRTEYDKLVLDRVTKKLMAQTTHPKKQMMMRKRVHDERVDKRHTTGKPTALEIIEEHNAIINFNAETTRKARRNYEDRNVKNKTNLKTVIGPMLAKVLSKKAETSAISKIKDKPLKKASSVTNHRRYYTPDDISSEEGLSIEVFKNSYRRMDNNISTDNVLNDTNVITKIKQFENELKVFKTKLKNCTGVIENLNSKLCETENKFKEFCNQQFKIVTKNNNTLGEFHLRANSNENDNGKSQIDKNNEFNKYTAKKLEAKRNDLMQSNANKNKQVLTSEPDKDSNIINRQSPGDMDIIEKPVKKKYETDIHKLTNDQDKVVYFSKSIKDEITNKSSKYVPTSNLNNDKYTVQERGEDRNIETTHNISKNYSLRTVKNNLNQKHQSDSNKFEKNIAKQADISIQEHYPEVKSNERNDNGKSQLDKYKEFIRDTAKKVEAKRNDLMQNNANKNKQVLTSEPNKDSNIINRQSPGDMDIIKKPVKKKYETDIHKLMNDQDKVVSFSKLTKDENTNKNSKYVPTSNLNNDKYTVQERGEDRNIETIHNISKNYSLRTVKNNLKKKHQLDSNKFEKNIEKQADISIQEQYPEIKSNEREIIGNIMYDFERSKQNNVQAIGRNDNPGKIESYYEIQSTRTIDPRFYKSDANMKYNANVVSQTTKYFDRSHIDKVIGKEQFNTENEYIKKENVKRIINRLSKSDNYANSGNHEYNTKPTEMITFQQTLPTRIMPSLVNLKSDNNLNVNPYEINFDINQANAEKHKNVIKAPGKEHEYDAYTESKISVINDMLGNKFNEEGVIIDVEKLNEIEAGEVVLDKPATESDLIVEHWLNAKKVENMKTPTDALFEDNPFKEVDVVLGRLAKDNLKYAR